MLQQPQQPQATKYSICNTFCQLQRNNILSSNTSRCKDTHRATADACSNQHAQAVSKQGQQLHSILALT
jgi:hypothetical protein